MLELLILRQIFHLLLFVLVLVLDEFAPPR